jgi:hypothetical protein
LNEAHLTLRDGTPVLIRRLVAEDAALYPDFLSDVTAEDLRLRFFGSMREVSHELLDKLIHYDPARAMAFIAVDEQSQKMLGVVRLHAPLRRHPWYLHRFGVCSDPAFTTVLARVRVQVATAIAGAAIGPAVNGITLGIVRQACFDLKAGRGSPAN